MYKKIVINNEELIIRILDSAGIPEDQNNRDYRAYLQWVADGNIAEIEDWSIQE